jgi:putative flippase GtrA
LDLSFPGSLRKHLTAKHKVKFKFLLTGVWNTVFGYVVFVGLDTLFAHFASRRYVAYMSAMVLSNIIAPMNAFIFHKYVTFRSDARGRQLLTEYLRFMTTYLVTFFLSLALMPLLVELAGLAPKIAAAVLILVCTIVSYLGHSKFSFRRGDHVRRTTK